jgi:hypothetical protein
MVNVISYLLWSFFRGINITVGYHIKMVIVIIGLTLSVYLSPEVIIKSNFLCISIFCFDTNKWCIKNSLLIVRSLKTFLACDSYTFTTRIYYFFKCTLLNFMFAFLFLPFFSLPWIWNWKLLSGLWTLQRILR